MALGGFSGRDPILSTDELADLVAGGTVRFFLFNDSGEPGGPDGRIRLTGDASDPNATGDGGRVPPGAAPGSPGLAPPLGAGGDEGYGRPPASDDGGFPGGGGDTQSNITSWVSETCSIVPASDYGSSTTLGGTLYDCATSGQGS